MGEWILQQTFNHSCVESFALPLDWSWMLKKIVDTRTVIVQWGGWDSLIKKGKFSINDAYKAIISPIDKVFWRRLVRYNKATPKCVFFIWVMIQQRFHTMDRLIKWRIHADPHFQLCQQGVETHYH